MNDRGISVLERYDLKVARTYRGRGAIICETDQGLKILREFTGSVPRAKLQDELLRHVRARGLDRVDCYIKNTDCECITYDKDRTGYVLKDWYEGRECDVTSKEEILMAVGNLAKLHQSMKLADSPLTEILKPGSIKEEYDKHTKELKKVKNYIRQKSKKTDFEIYCLKNFDLFFCQAEEVQGYMDKFDDSDYRQSGEAGKQICHGDYNYHNILFLNTGIATINFEKFSMDKGIKDLYQFMRKILEKNQWNQDLGLQMIDAYRAVKDLSKSDLENLWLRLAYPEKFWKLANYYFNSRKSWIPEKSCEKLKKLVEQERARRILVDKIPLLF